MYAEQIHPALSHRPALANVYCVVGGASRDAAQMFARLWQHEIAVAREKHAEQLAAAENDAGAAVPNFVEPAKRQLLAGGGWTGLLRPSLSFPPSAAVAGKR